MTDVTKILLVIRSLERGGTERHLLRTIPSVSNAHNRIEIFCFERPGELASSMKALGVNVVTPPLSGWLHHVPLALKPFSTVWTCLYFLIYIFFSNPKIIHFFLPAAYLLLGPVSLLHVTSKKIMSRRSLNKYLEKYPRLICKIEQSLHRRMDLILANSNSVFQELEQNEHVPHEKLRLIYNGVSVITGDAKKYRDDVRAEFGLPDDAVVLITVANLLPYKGHADLVEACGIVAATHKKQFRWALMAIGNDNVGLKATLEMHAAKLGIADNVHFVGKRTDIDRCLEAADIGVLVSHEEGFSNAILEGMAAGLPMIVSDVGGNPEAVVHSETGLVVPVKSSTKLAEAIEYLCLNRDLAAKMGEAGRKRAISNFSIERSAKGYAAVYDSLK
ncbi:MULTISPECIES: glycosyltransferase [Thalassospira]|uniref:Glycosyl transferase n=1 Tax=Thalassospira povalilytica TaxID=732237 RepID=A0ABX4RCP5_9PROT|nr:glycosyltransferase [Thalassospira povalilytica]PKR52378.1 glycosyl transferase [Thalassospira povalilytica]